MSKPSTASTSPYEKHFRTIKQERDNLGNIGTPVRNPTSEIVLDGMAAYNQQANVAVNARRIRELQSRKKHDEMSAVEREELTARRIMETTHALETLFDNGELTQTSEKKRAAGRRAYGETLLARVAAKVRAGLGIIAAQDAAPEGAEGRWTMVAADALDVQVAMYEGIVTADVAANNARPSFLAKTPENAGINFTDVHGQQRILGSPENLVPEVVEYMRSQPTK